ncbi:MAG TPA: RidA family protein [Pseudomonas sp.]|nr:RidA family protein [Pseudomonas sp.]
MNTAIKHYPSDLPFPFAKAVEVKGVLYFSGQVSMTPDAKPLRGSVQAQTDVIMGNVRETLCSLGADLSDVFKVTVWLSDMQHFSEFNQAYAAHFNGSYPVRSVVSAKLAFDLDVEIEVQAVAPTQS